MQHICLITVRTLGIIHPTFEHVVTITDLNDMQYSKIMHYVNEEAKLINNFMNPDEIRLLRTRNGKNVTAKTLCEKVTHLGYRLAILMMHNFRHKTSLLLALKVI